MSMNFAFFWKITFYYPNTFYVAVDVQWRVITRIMILIRFDFIFSEMISILCDINGVLSLFIWL